MPTITEFRYVKVKSIAFNCTHIAKIPQGCRLETEDYPNPEIEINEEEFKNTKKTPITNIYLMNIKCTLYKIDE